MEYVFVILMIILVYAIGYIADMTTGFYLGVRAMTLKQKDAKVKTEDLYPPKTQS
jgi:hypothetical protein